MSDLEPTEYPKPLEPTELARINNPYEITSPYDEIPTPPPPPKTGFPLKSVLIGFLIFLVIALLFLVGILISNSSHSTSNLPSTPTVNSDAQTATAITENATAFAANTATATATIQSKTALQILADMQAAGLQPYEVHATISECFTKAPTGLQSVVCFRNVNVCNLSCDEDMAWIEVFDNGSDAQADYQSWVQSNGPVPQVILSGNCVQAGNSMSGTYAQILAQDCR